MCRFDGIADWEMFEAQLAGQARVSMVCYDVVEWQHPDRVMRQFGCPTHIPKAPVNMLHYRKEKGATFTSEDWLVRWFVDISRWARFCNQLDGLVEETDIASEADYMAWYSEVSRTRLAKPQPQPQPRYASRELYPNLDGYRVVSICT